MSAHAQWEKEWAEILNERSGTYIVIARHVWACAFLAVFAIEYLHTHKLTGAHNGGNGVQSNMLEIRIHTLRTDCTYS